MEQKTKIISRSAFYTILVVSSFLLFMIVLSLISRLSTSASEMGLVIPWLVLGLIIILDFIIAIIYEIVRDRKDSVKDTQNSDAQAKEPTKVGEVTKILSFIFILISIYSLFSYFQPFFSNYKYVQLITNPNYESVYRLGNLSVGEILTSFYALILYAFFIFSFITFYFSIKNRKSSNLFLIISILVLFVVILQSMFGSDIYSGTVYQNGSTAQGGAADIVNTEKAIKANDANLCAKVGYSYYRNYCQKTILKQ